MSCVPSGWAVRLANNNVLCKSGIMRTNDCSLRQSRRPSNVERGKESQPDKRESLILDNSLTGRVQLHSVSERLTFRHDMNTKIGMNFSWFIGVQHEFTTKLKAGVDAIAFGFIMASYNTDTVFPLRGGLSIGVVRHGGRSVSAMVGSLPFTEKLEKRARGAFRAQCPSAGTVSGAVVRYSLEV